MSTTPRDAASLSNSAEKHLWMHFTRMSNYHDGTEVPIIVKGEGPYIYDIHGRRYLDALSGLFSVNMGHGRTDLGSAAAAQAAQLAHFPIWSYANPKAIELAERLAHLAPKDLNRVFFTSSGGEAVESAFKLIKQYHKLTGSPLKYKVISRNISYHGTTHGALSITGIPAAKQDFEPLVPGAIKVPNTNFYRAPEPYANNLEAFGRWAADRIEEAILFEGPETVAAVFIEPVQNAGGAFTPPPGYLQRVREICNQYNVIMVADEVITGFGRIGDWFAVNRYDVQPDIITCAKAMTSGYFPMGAVIVSDKLYEPFRSGTTSFLHGFTWGGHPVGSAVALANLDAMEKENINTHVRNNENNLLTTLETLKNIPIVGDVRGVGYFYAIELVRDQATKGLFTDDESERLLRGFLSKALFEVGLYCRADDRGEPVIMIAPPLICGQEHFNEMTEILTEVLTQATKIL